MSLTLTWADAADGTGGTATIAGADAEAVTVYAQVVDATGLRSPTWVEVGTRSGDGTVSVTLTPAYYWARADGEVSGSPAISNLVYALASDHEDALASRCVDAVAARLAGLIMAAASDAASASSPNERVYKHALPNENLMQYPCILLSHESTQETQEGMTTGKDDIGYPIRVRLIDRADAIQPARRKLWLMWRQQMFRGLRNQRLAGITEILTVKVEPGPVLDPQPPEYQIVVLSFVVRCLVRETRGV